MAQLTRLSGGIDSGNIQRAAVWLTQSFQAFQRGGFACAIWAKQAKNFAWLHNEADVVYSHKITVRFVKVRDVYHRVGHFYFIHLKNKVINFPSGNSKSFILNYNYKKARIIDNTRSGDSLLLKNVGTLSFRASWATSGRLLMAMIFRDGRSTFNNLIN